MRQIIRGIRNLIAFAPLIWRDRDFDYSYLLGMLVFKLHRMEAAFGSDESVSLGSDELAKELKLCHDALARALEDDYRTEELAAHEARWGEHCCPKCGGLFCDCFPVCGKDGSIISYKLVLEYPDAHGEDEQEQASDEKHAIYLQQDIDKDNDLKLAFRMMGERILWWWD